jgi:hypothetical protein
MQLRSKPQAIRRQLAAAVISLLGTSLAHAEDSNPETTRTPDKLQVDPSLLGPAPAPRQVATPDATYTPPPPRPMVSAASAARDQPWQVDGGLLWYKEGEARVQTTEAVVNLKRNYADESSVVVKLTVDSLTGGSPNGAMPSKAVQTFSTPSGTTLQQNATSVQTHTTTSGGVVGLGSCSSQQQSNLYSIAPGQLPIDKSFCDERIALSVARETPIGSADRLSYGGAVSHELDFLSYSGNAALAHDVNDKNTTLSAGFNLENDSIRPVGGAPVPLSAYDQFQKQGSKSKRVEDVLIGVTQIMSRRWITQLNYSLDRSNGYQNDPYKIISVLDSVTGGAAGPNLQGSPTYTYLYENRPELRTRKSLFWDNKFAFDRDVLQLSFRHMSDDWGISSQTVDLHYRWALGSGAYLEPHGRWYRQTAANFFHFFLPPVANASTPQPTDASADPRLAKFDATTAGLKFGIPMEGGGEFSLRVERYVQKGNGPATVPTQLQGLNLYPGLQAWIVQGGLSASF